MLARSRGFAIAALSFFAFGCEYQVDVEYEQVRLIAATEECPSDSSVSKGGDEAELVSTTALQWKALCWYRLEDHGSYPLCGRPVGDRAIATARASEKLDPPTTPRTSLEEQRSSAKDLLPPAQNGIYDPVTPGWRCTDEGPVLVALATDAGCQDLTGRTLADFGRPSSPDITVGELLARDERTPKTLCRYEMSGERTHRPFSCGSGGVLSPH